MLDVELLESYRAALHWSLTCPCDCAEKGHAEACRGGRKIAKSLIHLISFILGDEDEYRVLMDTIIENARRGRQAEAEHN